MSGQNGIVGLLFLSALFAGCADGDAAGGEANPVVIDPSTVGSIVGTVVGAEIEPLAGVSVNVLETGTSTLTDSAGAFLLEGLPPELLTLQFLLLGYESKALQAQVFQGDITDVTVVLNQRASTYPYSEVVIKKGFWYCGFQYIVAGLYCQIEDQFNVNYFNLTVAEGWNQTILEQRWDRNAGITTSGRSYGYFRTQNLSDESTYDLKETVRGESPIYAKFFPGYRGHAWLQSPTVLTSDYVIPHGIRGIEYSSFPWGLLGPELAGVYPEQPGVPNQGVGATLQTPFEVFFAQFYYAPSPDGYSSIPDD